MTNIKYYCDICGCEIGTFHNEITLKPDGIALWHDYEFCGSCYRKAKRGFKAVIKELKNEPLDEDVLCSERFPSQLDAQFSTFNYVNFDLQNRR